MDRDPIFFVPDKLRGIPLVSEVQTTTARSNIQQMRQDQAMRVGRQATSMQVPSAKSTHLDRTLRNHLVKEMERRQVDQMNLLQRFVSTTTQTPRKKVPATTTTTNKPIRSSSKPTKPQASSLKPPIKTTKKPREEARLLKPANETNRKSEKPTGSESSVTYSNSINLVGESGILLGRHILGASQPDYQRRAVQATVPSKYTSKLNGFGSGSADPGQSWVLFSRPDGKFALFELMALMSNIAIIVTIIFVIVFGWIRSVKKKRSLRVKDRSKERAERGQSKFVINSATPSSSSFDLGHPSAGNTPAPLGDRASSRVSSLFSASNASGDPLKPRGSNSTNHGPSPPPLMASIESRNPMAIKSQIEAITQLDASKLDGGIKKPTSELSVNPEQKAKDMSKPPIGQIEAPQANNKAMAIVQPTENSGLSKDVAVSSKLKDDFGGDDMKKPISPVSRPQSARHAPKTDDLKSQIDGEKCKNLSKEDPLNRSVPQDLSKSHLRSELIKKTPQIPSENSLDSIELPENLMRSFKKVDVKSQNLNITPSPNILLGENSKPDESNTEARIDTDKMKTDTSLPVNSSETSNNTDSKTSKPEEMNLTKDESPSKPDVEAKDRTKDNKLSQRVLKAEDSIVKPTPSPDPSINYADRPANPMGRDDVISLDRRSIEISNGHDMTGVKNHQVVVNKLDKRKTNLEIVDIRDESVTGKMGSKKSKTDGAKSPIGDETSGWISMDGVAVTQSTTPATPASMTTGAQVGQSLQVGQQTIGPIISPSDIIESRFNVDYNSVQSGSAVVKDGQKLLARSDSQDERSILNTIENELEQDGKLKNRKYFVYIVHDGHLTARKECIARIELPAKRRITLADLRQLIASSPDISLSSLRRSRFKFVTETYRLLNEDEDAAILHQVYPTQGVFLKINIAEQSENFAYPMYRGARSRMSSSSNSVTGQPTGSKSTSATSRNRISGMGRKRSSDGVNGSILPAIQVNEYPVRSTRSSQLRNGRNDRTRGRSTGSEGRGSQAKSQRMPGLGARSRSGLESRTLRRDTGNLKPPTSEVIDSGDMPDEYIGGGDSIVGMSAEMSADRMKIIQHAKYCSRPSCGCLAALRCGLCNFGYYCSVQCRVRDWPQHKQSCQSMQIPV